MKHYNPRMAMASAGLSTELQAEATPGPWEGGPSVLLLHIYVAVPPLVGLTAAPASPASSQMNCGARDDRAPQPYLAHGGGIISLPDKHMIIATLMTLICELYERQKFLYNLLGSGTRDPCKTDAGTGARAPHDLSVRGHGVDCRTGSGK